VKRIEMVNNSTNINKANNHFSPSLTEEKIKRKHDIVGNLRTGTTKW
jgi:hypothetical protein